MLTRVSFENFKALKKVDIDLSPFTVLVGKNASGKTSVLEGIHDLSRLPTRRVTSASARHWIARIFGDANDPCRMMTVPARGPMRITLADDGGAMSVMARRDQDPDGDERVSFTLGLTGHDPPEVIAPQGSFTGGRVANDQSFELDDQARGMLEAREMRRFGSAVMLRLDASVMVNESAPETSEPRLESDGEGLASVLNYLAGADPDRLAAIQQDLASVVPSVTGIRTFPALVVRQKQERIVIGDQAVNRQVEERIMGHRFALEMGRGRLVGADLLSEGTVLALGLLTALRHMRRPRLVLLDDIDKALHSTAQAELMRCIRKIIQPNPEAPPEVQFVCTTHSPDLLDHVGLDEVRVMALDKDGYAHCRSLADHPESAKWKKMLRTGEFWASVGEDWILGEGLRAAE